MLELKPQLDLYTWCALNRYSFTPEEVLLIVCNALEVPICRIHKKEKPQELVEARQVFCFYARLLTDAGWSGIGKLIGKDHTSCISGNRRVSELLDVKDEIMSQKLTTVHEYLLNDLSQDL